MENSTTVSVYLDTRRPKKSGKYPVKLKVYDPLTRKRKYYPTVFDMTEAEFTSTWETVKPRKEYKEVRRKLQAILGKAEAVVAQQEYFSFEQFEKRLYRKKEDGIRVAYHYKNTIENLNRNKQVGTANTYELAEKSIIRYCESLGEGYDTLSFRDITPGWLQGYENYMTDDLGRSVTTVSIYIRTLKTLYNRAIEDKEMDAEFFPFGRNKYRVPASKNTKKALSKAELKVLYDAEPENHYQEKAKDFWFFSYVCNGINIKDMALLKYKDIEDDRFQFYRAKTKNTSKSDLKPITVYLNDFAKEVIHKYGNHPHPNQLVFSIIDDRSSPADQQRQIKNFARFINQHVKKLAKANGLSNSISFYWARHSYASNIMMNGASLIEVMESLGHANIQTTQNYLKSLEDDSKKKLSESLLDF